MFICSFHISDLAWVALLFHPTITYADMDRFVVFRECSICVSHAIINKFHEVRSFFSFKTLLNCTGGLFNNLLPTSGIKLITFRFREGRKDSWRRDLENLLLFKITIFAPSVYLGQSKWILPSQFNPEVRCSIGCSFPPQLSSEGLSSLRRTLVIQTRGLFYRRILSKVIKVL